MSFAVSMKSGLRDRNNWARQIYLVRRMTKVSMKSGLRDRNNAGDRQAALAAKTSQ